MAQGADHAQSPGRACWPESGRASWGAVGRRPRGRGCRSRDGVEAARAKRSVDERGDTRTGGAAQIQSRCERDRGSLPPSQARRGGVLWERQCTAARPRSVPPLVVSAYLRTRHKPWPRQESLPALSCVSPSPAAPAPERAGSIPPLPPSLSPPRPLLLSPATPELTVRLDDAPSRCRRQLARGCTRRACRPRRGAGSSRRPSSASVRRLRLRRSLHLQQQQQQQQVGHL